MVFWLNADVPSRNSPTPSKK